MFKTFIKGHWDWATACGGMFATITFNNAVGTLIGLATLGFILVRLCVYTLKLRMTWRHRNNTAFFFKVKDEEDTDL